MLPQSITDQVFRINKHQPSLLVSVIPFHLSSSVKAGKSPGKQWGCDGPWRTEVLNCTQLPAWARLGKLQQPQCSTERSRRAAQAQNPVFKMIRNCSNHLVLWSKGTESKWVIASYFVSWLQLLKFYNVVSAVVSDWVICTLQGEKKTDLHMKGDTSESKCWLRDLNISKIFIHFCFQIPMFRHWGFHLNRDWPVVSLSSLRIEGQELREK